MKIKNLGFFEKHLEKIVIGVAGVFFLVVLWFFVLSSPYEVSAPIGGVKLSPQELETQVMARVRQLETSLNRREVPQELKDVTVPSYFKDVQARLGAPVSPVGRYQVTLGNPGITVTATSSSTGPGTFPRYALPEPPKPGKPLARADYAVLAELREARQMRPWLRITGVNDPPRDFTYVGIMAAYDINAWARALKTGPEPRVREEWVAGVDHLLTCVILERQMLDPRTGAWGETEVVRRGPGYVGFENLPAQMAGERVGDIARRIAAMSYRIAHERFPIITADRDWLPANIPPEKLRPDVRRQVSLLSIEILKKTRLAMLAGGAGEEEEEEVAVPEGNAPAGENPVMAPTPGMPGDFSMVPGAPGMGVGPMMSGAPTGAGGSALDQEIAALISQRDALLKEVGAAVEPLPSRGQPLMLYDFTARPGQTYRYRVVVGLFNPLFQRDEVEATQRKEMSNRLTLLSAPGAWSEPVRIPPQAQYFLAKASVEQGISTWDVFRVVKGRPVRGEFTARPGDHVGGILNATIDGQSYRLPVDLRVCLVDLEAVDTRFGPSARAILMNAGDGSILERTVAEDSDNPTYRRLREEIRQLSAPPPTPTVTPPPGMTPTPPPGPVPGRTPPGRPPEGYPPVGPFPGSTPPGYPGPTMPPRNPSNPNPR